MFSWHSIPFSRVAIPVALGIIASYYFELQVKFISGILATSLLALWLLPKIVVLGYRYNWRSLKGSLLVLMSFYCGLLLGNLSFYCKPETHFSRLKADFLDIRIVEIRKDDSNKMTAIAEVEHTISKGKSNTCQGLLYLSIFKKDSGAAIQTNRHYLIPNKIRVPESNKLPWEFDFAYYLKTNGIHHCAVLSSSELIDAGSAGENLYSYAEYSKNVCLRTLRELLKDRSYWGIAEGLLIGYRDDIDSGVSKGFSISGTVHILSTSGMHVALIYGLLQVISGYLKRNKKTRLLQYLLLVSGLWFYAFICGLGPSIVRACITFSLIGLGRLIDRKSDTINLVFATAFFQLLIQPLALFQIAFQLSYAAVFGILTLHPIISELLFTDKKYLKPVRDIISVSLAAQLFTFPITSYYFGSFPSLFLIGNLLLIPLSGLILYVSIALLTFQGIPYLNTILIECDRRLIDVNNKIALYFGGLDQTNIRGMHIGLGSACLLGLLIMLTTAALKYRQKGLLFFAGVIAICFSLTLRMERIRILDSEARVFLDKRARTFYLTKGEDAYIIWDSTFVTTQVKREEAEYKMKSCLGIKKVRHLWANESFVATNFIFIPGLGFQFFDKIMTLK